MSLAPGFDFADSGRDAGAGNDGGGVNDAMVAAAVADSSSSTEQPAVDMGVETVPRPYSTGPALTGQQPQSQFEQRVGTAPHLVEGGSGRGGQRARASPYGYYNQRPSTGGSAAGNRRRRFKNGSRPGSSGGVGRRGVGDRRGPQPLSISASGASSGGNSYDANRRAQSAVGGEAPGSFELVPSSGGHGGRSAGSQSQFRTLRELRHKVKYLGDVTTMNDALSEKLHALRAAAAVRDAQNHELGTEVITLKDTLANAQFENSRLRTEITRVYGDKAEVARKLKRALLEVEEVRYQTQQMRRDVDALSAESSHRVKGLVSYFNAQMSKFNQTQALNQSLTKRLHELERRHAPCDKTIFDLKQQLIEVEKTCQATREDVVVITTTAEHRQQHVEQLQARLEESQLACTRAEAATAEQVKECQRLKDASYSRWWESVTNEQIAEKAQASLQDARFQVNRLARDVSNQQRPLHDALARAATLETSVRTLTEQNTAKDITITELNNELRQTASQLAVNQRTVTTQRSALEAAWRRANKSLRQRNEGGDNSDADLDGSGDESDEGTDGRRSAGRRRAGNEGEDGDGDKKSSMAALRETWLDTVLTAPYDVTKVDQRVGAWMKTASGPPLRTSAHLKRLNECIKFAASLAQRSYQQLVRTHHDTSKESEALQYSLDTLTATHNDCERCHSENADTIASLSAELATLQQTMRDREAEFKDALDERATLRKTTAEQEQARIDAMELADASQKRQASELEFANASLKQVRAEYSKLIMANNELLSNASNQQANLEQIRELKSQVDDVKAELVTAQSLHSGCGTFTAQIKDLHVCIEAKDKERDRLNVVIEKLNQRLQAATVASTGTESENRAMLKKISQTLTQTVAAHKDCAHTIQTLQQTIATQEERGGVEVVSRLQEALSAIKHAHGPCAGQIADLTAQLDAVKAAHAECPTKEAQEADALSLKTALDDLVSVRKLANENSSSARTLAGMKKVQEKKKERENESVDRLKQMKPIIASMLKSSKQRDGVLITDTVPEGPAVLAGLSVNDKIVSVNSKPTGTVAEYRAILKTLLPGEQVCMMVIKEGHSTPTLVMVELGTIGYTAEQIMSVRRLASYVQRGPRDYQARLPSLPIDGIDDSDMYY